MMEEIDKFPPSNGEWIFKLTIALHINRAFSERPLCHTQPSRTFLSHSRFRNPTKKRVKRSRRRTTLSRPLVIPYIVHRSLMLSTAVYDHLLPPKTRVQMRSNSPTGLKVGKLPASWCWINERVPDDLTSTVYVTGEDSEQLFQSG